MTDEQASLQDALQSESHLDAGAGLLCRPCSDDGDGDSCGMSVDGGGTTVSTPAHPAPVFASFDNGPAAPAALLSSAVCVAEAVAIASCLGPPPAQKLTRAQQQVRQLRLDDLRAWDHSVHEQQFLEEAAFLEAVRGLE